MENVYAVDTTLFFKDNTWFLFVNMLEREGGSSWGELFLFFADHFRTTRWTPHPQNPVVSDVCRARPAGRLFYYKDILYRPSQDNSIHYGRGLNLNEINELTKINYEEKIVTKAFPKWDKELKQLHSFGYEKGLTVIDGTLKRKRF